MEKNKRKVNKKLIQALLAYGGLTYTHIGQRCDPPVTRMAICIFLGGGYVGGERLREQIAVMLDPILDDMIDEVHADSSFRPYPRDISKILFPQVNNGEPAMNIQEESIVNLHVKEGENHASETCTPGMCGENGQAPHVGVGESGVYPGRSV